MVLLARMAYDSCELGSEPAGQPINERLGFYEQKYEDFTSPPPNLALNIPDLHSMNNAGSSKCWLFEEASMDDSLAEGGFLKGF